MLPKPLFPYIPGFFSSGIIRKIQTSNTRMALKSHGRIGCCYTIYHFIKALKPIILGFMQEDCDMEIPVSLHDSTTTLKFCYNPKGIDRRKIYAIPFI